MKISISLLDSASTDALGAQLVAALPPCPNAWMILLQGELGAGKSTLARAMLRSMGHAGAVPSPTYTLVEPYSFADFTAYHIDLYRMESELDVDMLDLEYYFDQTDYLIFVEWAEKMTFFQRPYVNISINRDEKGDRLFVFEDKLAK